MGYEYFFRYFNPDDIKVVFEIGARWGEDSIKVHRVLSPDSYHIFEANPEVCPTICSSIRAYGRGNFSVVNAAVYTTDNEDITFNICKSNVGASSILGKVQEEFYQKAYGKTELEPSETTICSEEDWRPITVKTLRLDTYCRKQNIPHIDLICMDVEGVGLSVLKGLGDHIRNVRYIISECDYGYTRAGEETFDMMNEYLTAHGFRIIENKKQLNILSDCLWERTSPPTPIPSGPKS